jgi:hypothetical protein
MRDIGCLSDCGLKNLRSHRRKKKERKKKELVNILKVVNKFGSFMIIILHIVPPSWPAMKQTLFCDLKVVFLVDILHFFRCGFSFTVYLTVL